MTILIHPGEILKEEFMDPHGLSSTALAASLDVPANRISDIVRGRRDITADTASRLSAHFGNTPEFWLGLQAQHDLDVAQEAHKSDYRAIKRIKEPEMACA